MACPNRIPGGLHASALRRLPAACTTRRPDNARGTTRRASGRRDAGRGAVACRAAWPSFEADDASASEGGS